MPIRLLHFIGQLGVGGCEKQLLELCRRIDRSKFELAVCSYSEKQYDLAPAFEKAGIRLFFVNKFSGIPKWQFLSTLRRFVQEFRPDIIHTWQYSANVWGRLAGLSCGHRRFVSSERGARPYGRHMWVLERILGRQTVWTANTDAVAQTIHQYLGVPRPRIHVVHNAVEAPGLDRATCRTEVRSELGLEPDTTIVLTVGRQTAAKNYPMFFRTAQRVLRQMTRVVFVGVGHGEQEAMLCQLQSRLGLQKDVLMLGLRHDVPRLMAAADIFVLCSDWEGFPNALVEAMSMGLPVVTTTFAGVEEIIGEGNRVCLTSDRDRDDQMAEQICRLISNPELMLSLGAAASQIAATRFGWDRLLGTMESFYERFMLSPSLLLREE